jgi:hypothetical protein
MNLFTTQYNMFLLETRGLHQIPSSFAFFLHLSGANYSLSKRATPTLKEKNMKNLKLAALVLVTALSGTFASLAASQPANWQTTATVDIFATTESSIEINAMSLIDNSQLIRLQYGFLELDKIIKVKSIVAPDALKVSMDECSLGTDSNGNPSLKFIFDLESTTGFGTYPVLITLENTGTGQTTTLAIDVTVQ